MKTFQGLHLFRWEFKRHTVGQSKRDRLESCTYTSRCWEMMKKARRREKRPASVWIRQPLLPKTEEKTSSLQRSTDRMNKQVLPTFAVLTCGCYSCRRRWSCAGDSGGVTSGSCSWRGGGWGPAPRKTYSQFVELWLELQTDPRLHQWVIFIQLQVVEVVPQEILNFTDCQVLGEQQRWAWRQDEHLAGNKIKAPVWPTNTDQNSTPFQAGEGGHVHVDHGCGQTLDEGQVCTSCTSEMKNSKIGLMMRLVDQRLHSWLQLWGVFAYVDKTAGAGTWWERLW